MIPAQVVVLHLARRPDRLVNFRNRWRAAGLPVTPLILTATDQTANPPPDPRWKTFPHGTYGCWDSHIRALRTAVAPVLILEDDVVFADYFAQALAELTLPPDWDICHLGGQHLLPPQPFVPGLVRPTRMLRSHAYLARYPHVLAGALRGTKNHVDYAFGSMPMRRYATSPWLVGQDDSPGDITRRDPHGIEFWQEEPPVEAHCGA